MTAPKHSPLVGSTLTAFIAAMGADAPKPASGGKITCTFTHEGLVAAMSAAIAACHAEETREALRDLHDDIQGRIDDGAHFNPGTLNALKRARSLLAKLGGQP